MAKSARRKWLTCFVPHRLELYLSPSWREAPRPLRRILERLEIEWLRHGGNNNGELYVAYSQFEDAGVSRRSIRPALDLGALLGLLAVARSEVISNDIRLPNAYRLTYLETKGAKAPTDEWKLMTDERVKTLVASFKQTETADARVTKRRAA